MQALLLGVLQRLLLAVSLEQQLLQLTVVSQARQPPQVQAQALVLLLRQQVMEWQQVVAWPLQLQAAELGLLQLQAWALPLLQHLQLGQPGLCSLLQRQRLESSTPAGTGTRPSLHVAHGICNLQGSVSLWLCSIVRAGCPLCSI